MPPPARRVSPAQAPGTAKTAPVAGPPAAPPGSAATRPTPSGRRPPTRNGPPALRPAPTPRLAPGPPARPPTGPAPPHPGTPPRAAGLPAGLRIPARPPLSTCRDRPERPAKAGLAARLRIPARPGPSMCPVRPRLASPTPRAAGVRRGGGTRTAAPLLTGSARLRTRARPPLPAVAPRLPHPASGLAPMVAGLAIRLRTLARRTLARLPPLTSLARLRTVSPTLRAAGVRRGGGTRTAAPLLTGSARLRTRARPPLPAVAPRLPHPASGLAPMVAGLAIRLRTSARPGPSMFLARPRLASLTLPAAGVPRGGGTRTAAPLPTGSARLRTQARPRFRCPRLVRRRLARRRWWPARRLGSGLWRDWGLRRPRLARGWPV